VNEETNRGGRPTVIIGAGLAGLTAAYELDRVGRPVRVFERDLVHVAQARRGEVVP